MRCPVCRSEGIPNGETVEDSVEDNKKDVCLGCPSSRCILGRGRVSKKDMELLKKYAEELHQQGKRKTEGGTSS